MASESDRKWIPTEWLDEVLPRMRPTPDAYIERDGAGWAMRLPLGDADRDNDFYAAAIEDGQIVDFSHVDDLGAVVVTVAADRSFTVDRPVPEQATHFYDGALDIAETIAEAVNGDPEWPDTSEPLEPGEHVIRIAHWGHASFRFDATAARFILCAGAN